MRYFFHIAYDGHNYRGWQRQPKVTTLQEVLENTLGKILKRRIYCIGCGRTDAQVHASQYFFHIDVEQPLRDDLLFVANKILPIDISIFEIIPVEGNQHAQYDAKERTYDYYIHTQKNAFLSKYSSLCLYPHLDLEAMRTVIAFLPKHQEYRNFCKTPDKHNHTLVEVRSAQLYSNTKGDQLRFEIIANRYLRGMIRILVDRILAVGMGQMSVATFRRYLLQEETPEFMNMAYPQGLYLSAVRYAFMEVPSVSKFPLILMD